jgi:signal transduction histidine kinase
MDSDEFTLHKEEHALDRIIRESMELIGPLAQQKKSTLHHEVEPIRANVDSLKLSQVFVNLLNNAIQHNRDGIEVSVRLKRIDNKAVVTVTDNGQGIPNTALEHLFDRFYRLEKSRTHTKGNTGLGLAISKGIVDAHGGTIKVESVVGRGARFTVELPLG